MKHLTQTGKHGRRTTEDGTYTAMTISGALSISSGKAIMQDQVRLTQQRPMIDKATGKQKMGRKNGKPLYSTHLIGHFTSMQDADRHIDQTMKG